MMSDIHIREYLDNSRGEQANAKIVHTKSSIYNVYFTNLL